MPPGSQVETAGEYLRDRIRTLWPVPLDDAPNPISLLASLTGRQWAYFMVGFFAWAWDAFDFYSVPVLYQQLSDYFTHGSEYDLVWATTLALISRGFGAAIFGVASDVFGRKWPFVVNCALLMALELSTGFCQTYGQFLAVRTLFGLAMGGIYGNAVATALEDIPERARGLFSGIFQAGYPFGCLLATAFEAIFVHTNDTDAASDANNTNRLGESWRRLYWFGSGWPILLIVARLLLKRDTDTFESRPMPPAAGSKLEITIEGARIATARNWKLLLYLCVMLSWLAYLSHGTQDLYGLLLERKYPDSSTTPTRILVTAFIGALFGSVVVGYCSQIFGRRFSMIAMGVLGGTVLYLYAFATGPGNFVFAFAEQFCIQGIWGIIPIYLIELAPSFRTFVVGTSYHVGTMIAAASNTIETLIGNKYELPPQTGLPDSDYRYAISFVGAVAYLFAIFFIAIGPERKGIPLDLNFL